MMAASRRLVFTKPSRKLGIQTSIDPDAWRVSLVLISAIPSPTANSPNAVSWLPSSEEHVWAAFASVQRDPTLIFFLHWISCFFWGGVGLDDFILILQLSHGWWGISGYSENRCDVSNFGIDENTTISDSWRSIDSIAKKREGKEIEKKKKEWPAPSRSIGSREWRCSPVSWPVPAHQARSAVKSRKTR